MFPMTVSVHNAAQLTAVMAALGGELPALTSPAAEKGRTARVAKTETAQATVANGASSTPETSLSAPAEAAAKETTAEAPPPAPSAVAGVPTYADAAKAITDLSKVKGRDAAVKVLAEFGAQKLPDVKPEQFAAVIAAANKAGA